jgi:hypothetical protein
MTDGGVSVRFMATCSISTRIRVVLRVLVASKAHKDIHDPWFSGECCI